MRQTPGLLLLLLLLASGAAAQPPLLAAPPAKADPATVGTDLIDRLARGEFQAAAGNFSEAMRSAAPPEKLSEIWTALQAQMGPFKRRTGVRVETQGAYKVAFVTAELERSTVDLKVVVDAAGKVAGFFIVLPRPASGPEPPPPGYVHREAFHEQDVTVGAGEWALPGTLSMPVGPGPFPALVLVHGSGPNDRDETVGAEKPFRDLAWGLASRGVAVLRYEKRTREHGARLGNVAGFTVQQETVDDALAAADLLRHTAAVDPKRVFVLGHSLGGMLIPRIGQRDPRLAGLIVMAGAARPLEDVILEQVSYLAAADGQVTDTERSQIESLRAEVARVKALKPGDTGTALGAPDSYWLDLRGYNPPEAARALKAPLLVLQGERDYQVTMDNLDLWKKALSGRPGVTFKTYPKLDHLFVEGEGKSTPADYEKPGHVAETVIADIAAWIGK
jgi:dienelactone hydrolase